MLSIELDRTTDSDRMTEQPLASIQEHRSDLCGAQRYHKALLDDLSAAGALH